MGKAAGFIYKIDYSCILVIWALSKIALFGPFSCFSIKTEPAYLHNNFNVNLLAVSSLDASGATGVSVHANIIFCVNVLVVRYFASVFFDVGLSSYFLM